MNRYSKLFCSFFVALATQFALGCSGESPEENASQEVVDSSESTNEVQAPPRFLGGDRPASYVLPTNYAPEIEMPLVILLHGFTGTSIGQDNYFGLSQVTKARGVMLLMPDGRVNPDGNQFWNATDFCCDFYRSGVDDVAYLSSLIDEAKSYFNIDARKVYLIGHSNGGYMSYRMACDRSEQITGIVSLAGSTWHDEVDCGNPQAVAVLQVHGTWDTTILYGGKAKRAADSTGGVDSELCLAEQCMQSMDTCDLEPSCREMWSCFEQCESSANREQCNGQCWEAAPEESRTLWMDAFLCGLESACWDDKTRADPGYLGAEAAVAWWAEQNGCGQTPQEGSPIDIVVDLPREETMVLDYPNCPQGQQASLWKIQNGSHVPFFNGNWSSGILDWLLLQSKAE